MDAVVQLIVLVAADADSINEADAAHNVYPADGVVPGVCVHPDGVGVNDPLAHVYVLVPVGPDGIVAAHW